MQINNCLIELGLNEEEVKYFHKSTHLRDTNIAREKIAFFKSYLNISDEELKQIVVCIPPILGYSHDENSPTSVQSKVKFYQNLFKISEDEAKNLIIQFPQLLGYDISGEGTKSVKGKLNYFQNLLGFSDGEVAKLFKNNPSLLTHNIEETITERVEFLKQTFDIDDNSVKKLIKNYTNIVSYNENTILGKINFYQELFGTTRKQVLKIIQSLPTLLSYDTSSEEPESVLGKVKSYQSIFKLAKHDVLDMIKKCPSILCYSTVSKDESAISSKLEMLKDIADKESIVKNPSLLSHPALKVKLRYLILSTAFSKNEILENRKMTTSELKLWARKRFLEENGGQARQMIKSESRFQNTYKISDKELIEMYPLTNEDVDSLEKEHYERTGESVCITMKERFKIFSDLNRKTKSFEIDTEEIAENE